MNALSTGGPTVSRPPRDLVVNLMNVVAVIHEHLTEALCEGVFEETRCGERRRKWTLYALVRFWVAVILNAPPSLTRALEESHLAGPLFPQAPASSEAFFKRCQRLRPDFFARLYEAYLAKVLPSAPRAYGSPLASLRDRFPEVWVIDGSRLDKIAHRLKVLRDVAEVVLPGCLTVCYDVFRGVARVVAVSTDASRSEHLRGEEVLAKVPRGTLLVGDRLYATAKFIGILVENGLHGLFRRNRLLKVRPLGKTPGRRRGRGQPKDDLVEIGSGQGAPKQTVRRIRLGRRLELFTTVLDPKVLSAEEALALYRMRWTVERLFFDLKEVLHLGHFYAANPRAVAMQVYAAALVHVAMRVAQARVAEEAGIAPEAISPAKFFPSLAAASIMWTVNEHAFDVIQDLNSTTSLRRPDWRILDTNRVRITSILVETRNGQRRRPGFSKARARWTSFAKVKGAEALS